MLYDPEGCTASIPILWLRRGEEPDRMLKEGSGRGSHLPLHGYTLKADNYVDIDSLNGVILFNDLLKNAARIRQALSAYFQPPLGLYPLPQ